MSQNKRWMSAFLGGLIAVLLHGCGAPKEGLDAVVDGGGVSKYQESVEFLNKGILPSQAEAFKKLEKYHSQQQIMKQCDGESFRDCFTRLAENKVKLLEQEIVEKQSVFEEEVKREESITEEIEKTQTMRASKPRSSSEFVYFRVTNESKYGLMAKNAWRVVYFNDRAEVEGVATMQGWRIDPDSWMKEPVFIDDPLMPGQDGSFVLLMRESGYENSGNTPQGNDFLRAAVVMFDSLGILIMPSYLSSTDENGKPFAFERTMLFSPEEHNPRLISNLKKVTNAFLTAT